MEIKYSKESSIFFPACHGEKMAKFLCRDPPAAPPREHEVLVVAAVGRQCTGRTARSVQPLQPAARGPLIGCAPSGTRRVARGCSGSGSFFAPRGISHFYEVAAPRAAGGALVRWSRQLGVPALRPCRAAPCRAVPCRGVSREAPRTRVRGRARRVVLNGLEAPGGTGWVWAGRGWAGPSPGGTATAGGANLILNCVLKTLNRA